MDIKIEKLKFKLNAVGSLLADPKTCCEKGYIKLIQLNTLEAPIENENYLEINTEPENFIAGSFKTFQRHKAIRWNNFGYDLPEPKEFETQIKASKTTFHELLGEDKEDPRSGLAWKEVDSILKLWNDSTKNDNFLLIINVFVGDYESVSKPDSFFSDRYSSTAPLLSALLALNSLANFTEEVAPESADLEQYLSILLSSVSSNRKNMVEIVKLVTGDASTIGMAFSEAFKTDSSNLSAFFKITCSAPTFQPDIEAVSTLLKNMTITETEFEVVKKIAEVSAGSMSSLCEILDPQNTKEKKLHPDASISLRQIVLSLEYEDMHSEKNLIKETFNIKQRTNLSIQQRQNEFGFRLALFNMACAQFPKGIPQEIKLNTKAGFNDLFGDFDPDLATPEQKENQAIRPKLEMVFDILTSFASGKFSILFDNYKDDILLEALKVIRKFHIFNLNSCFLYSMIMIKYFCFKRLIKKYLIIDHIM